MKTCEGYVIEKLNEAEQENKNLKLNIEALKQEIEAWELKFNREMIAFDKLKRVIEKIAKIRGERKCIDFDWVYETDYSGNEKEDYKVLTSICNIKPEEEELEGPEEKEEEDGK